MLLRRCCWLLLIKPSCRADAKPTPLLLLLLDAWRVFCWNIQHYEAVTSVVEAPSVQAAKGLHCQLALQPS